MRHNSNSNPVLQLALVLCLSQLFLVEIRAVPASVLAQNTELSTSANNKHQQQQQLEKLQEQQQQQQPAAVKRSAEETTSEPLANKKSSPEIVPASYSNAPAARSSSNSASPSQQVPAGVYALPSNEEILAAVAAAAQNSQQQVQEEPTALEEAVASSTMRKRGINYEYNPYLPASTVSDYGNDVPSGVWSDDYEAAVPVAYGERDLQEIDDYVPERRVTGTTGRNKAYDNLQNLLNAEAYLESIPLSVPLTYANRNYNLDDRNKRGIYYNLGNSAGSGSSSGSGYNSENINLSKYRRFNDMRLKRDTTKLNPADMLALVALVEAGERARKESDVESSGPVPMISSDDLEYMPQATWLDAPVQAQPSLVDYYGMPLEAQNQVIPKYEYVPRQHKYSGVNSRFGSSKQRYMVAKKKRSVSQSQFMNEAVGDRSSSYNGEKYY
ncbi:uncharacterized protein [Drosophila bipectinata]|uniref:uncharacterized protein n=1 Tax=Drosophila bipectinata TaxID=42026 RepID=UPI001C899FE5|nr:uncharacterized protein LOC108132431 [Drosophila bipectinata]